MMQLPILIGCCIMLLLALSACREVNGVLYSKFYDIPAEGWDPVKTIGYDPWPADSAMAVGDFDFYACVRYSGKKTIPPLRCVVTCEDESGTLAADTITLTLFDAKGEPTGRGRYGIYEISVPIMTGFKLAPGFGADIRSLTPIDDTKGLLSVGTSLCRHGLVPESAVWSKL
jgi:gliding motility-associated lipoprotein GldH